MNLKKTVICLFIFLIVGCKSTVNKTQNPYYFGMTMLNRIDLKKTNKVTIYEYTDDNIKYFLDNGYIIKAKSSFRSTYVKLSWAELAAKQMGSEIILCKNNYVGRENGRKIIPWYVPGETYTINSKTTAAATANSLTNTTYISNKGYGISSSSSKTSATYKSNTTTTIQTPGKYQFYSVPYSYDYYDQYAVFLVKESDVLAMANSVLNKIDSMKDNVIIGNNYKTKTSIPISNNPDISESKILGYTSKNEKIIIIEKVNEKFYKVMFRSKIGYVLSSWIE